ncbi:MAG TPA: RnfABCDGE type electron transport complex subunit G [Candidatus Omnitrophota bacterium]|nr:RnfABCDGE type electron transport complex subunit G [Candidatus Omnitrophota bacterium]HSA31920.1 RnfABCDGE type electron transport complex subunit G [Candidatus Omnitrophota bacterium]
MSKTPSTFFNMVLTLFVVSFLSSAGLGWVYELTKDPIEEATRAKKAKAIEQVVPAFNNNPMEERRVIKSEGGELIFYPVRKDGTLVGTAVETFTDKGFGGRVKLMVGLLPNGSIQDIVVVEHKETPGLGDKMEAKKSGFTAQFKGKDPAQFKVMVKKDGGDVDAITAATISSRAFCDALNRAYQTYIKEEKP